MQTDHPLLKGLTSPSPMYQCQELNHSEMIFTVDISNAFQNTSLPNREEMVYLNLPHL